MDTPSTNDPSKASSTQIEKVAPFVTNTTGSIFALKNLPEVIKGALFSRYSRSYLGLRELLLKDFINDENSAFNQISQSTPDSNQQGLAIEKAQSFYDRILDGYGDDSIGELGGAHLAIENISMIAAKKIEDKRIGGSPLEKSTRYIYFDRKVEGKYPYYREPTLMAEDPQLYESTCDKLFETYSRLSKPLTSFMELQFPQDEQTPNAAYGAALRAKVLDCLRGLLPASTQTNMGVFGNGRFFENLLIDLELSDLPEMRQIASTSRQELSQVIPSFIRRSYPDNRHFGPTRDYHLEIKQALNSFARDLSKPSAPKEHFKPHVRLIYRDPEAVDKIIASLLFDVQDITYTEAIKQAKELSQERRASLFQMLGQARGNRRHKAHRAFEHAFFCFEIEGDFGVWRDLQRHRMLTQQQQILGCHLGYSIGDDIINAGLRDEYEEALTLAAKAHARFAHLGESAQYIVPMAYHLRWSMHVNFRSIQWLCELRSSAAGHAQYRYIAQEMASRILEVEPLLEPLLGYVDYAGHPLGRLTQETRRVQRAQAR